MEHATRRPLKVGVFLPFAEGMMGGATPRWSDLLAFGQCAEELGYDSLWLGDHLLFRFPEPRAFVGGETTAGAWDVWSLLAALAATTKRIELGPLVACTGFHSPPQLAKMAATIEEISGGRLILGLGAGWHEPEFRAFGYPFDARVSRFEEAWTIIRTLLREGQIDFVGKYYQARECELRPVGPRSAGPPLLVGSSGPRMLRITMPHADMWNTAPWDDSRPERFRPQREALNAVCREVGRDPASVGHTVGVTIDSLRGRVGATKGAHSGPPEVLADLLRSFAGEGFSHIQIAFEPNTLASLEAFAPTLALLDQG